ncbi:MAG: hypothetical protein P1V81_08435 [Planctomycetota bacterium]|nr:hypothetical protein [Planctomycetota bacterium]
MSQVHDPLVAQLDALARRGNRELSARQASAAFAGAADRSLPLVWLIPTFGLAVALIDLAFTGSPRLVPLGVLFLLALLAPLAWSGGVALAAFLAPAERRSGLRVVDHDLGLKGRLQAADEFLASAKRGPFEQAAIEDARLVVRRAERSPLAAAHEGWRPNETVAPHLVAGALALVAYGWLGLSLASTPNTAPLPPTTVAAAAPDADGDEPTEAERPAVPEETPAAADKVQNDAAKDASEARRGDAAKQLPDELRSSEGKTGKGKSADAQGQSAASESRGAPSGQTPAPPKGDPKKALESKPPKKKDSADDPPRPPKEEGDPGGSTAGRGSAKGSNRNTVTSKWSAKDQVTTPDDQEIEDDEDTDDEEEEQENRGGMQPNLRDRRPPVSRDLRIGFGNQPNPDANGRGGPSEAKKSRGTASLVLGVPIPDRIKGQPNPGPTRITQERVEPSPEAHDPVPARARDERSQPVGGTSRPSAPGPIEPWMNQLIKRYLDGRRARP